MPGAQHLTSYARTQLPSWRYLNGETLVTPTPQTLNMPGNTDTIVISAETAACYYAINGVANPGSDGYVPSDGLQVIGPIANLTSVSVYSATGTIHVQYYCEV
jgi:hypothetical protein